MTVSRTLNLQCPTCGGTDFNNAENQDPASVLECVSCHRSTTREQLIEDNAELIEIQKKEMVGEVAEQVRKDLTKTLRDAFRGNKYIKIT